jgi:hypothetical protein
MGATETATTQMEAALDACPAGKYREALSRRLEDLKQRANTKHCSLVDRWESDAVIVTRQLAGDQSYQFDGLQRMSMLYRGQNRMRSQSKQRRCLS